MNTDWMLLLLPVRTPEIGCPGREISHREHWMLSGIHYTKYEEFLFIMFLQAISAYSEDTIPLKVTEAVAYLPWVGLAVFKKDEISNSSLAISIGVSFLARSYSGWRGRTELEKKCNLGKGTRLTACFLRLELIWPGNLRPQVRHEIAVETISLRFM